jgi:hypothetical protein
MLHCGETHPISSTLLMMSRLSRAERHEAETPGGANLF